MSGAQAAKLAAAKLAPPRKKANKTKTVRAAATAAAAAARAACARRRDLSLRPRLRPACALSAATAATHGRRVAGTLGERHPSAAVATARTLCGLQ